MAGMRRAIGHMALQSIDSAPSAMYYAFKQVKSRRKELFRPDGQAFLRPCSQPASKWMVPGQMRTERMGRMIGIGTMLSRRPSFSFAGSSGQTHRV